MVLLMLWHCAQSCAGQLAPQLAGGSANYFFVNIPPDERAPFIEFLKVRGAQTSRVLPMIRGRLTAINDRPIEGAQSAGDGENFAAREQNLTWDSRARRRQQRRRGPLVDPRGFPGSRSCLSCDGVSGVAARARGRPAYI